LGRYVQEENLSVKNDFSPEKFPLSNSIHFQWKIVSNEIFFEKISLKLLTLLISKRIVCRQQFALKKKSK